MTEALRELYPFALCLVALGWFGREWARKFDNKRRRKRRKAELYAAYDRAAADPDFVRHLTGEAE